MQVTIDLECLEHFTLYDIVKGSKPFYGSSKAGFASLIR